MLLKLSDRVQRLTEQIPHVETVRGLFANEGSKTGSQFRAAMHVLDVTLMKAPEEVLRAANALTAWYWHVRKAPFFPEDFVTLRHLTTALWGSFEPFAVMGCPIQTPKMHCCGKMAETIALFGTCEHTSTDSYERAHKAHKAVYQRYVSETCDHLPRM